MALAFGSFLNPCLKTSAAVSTLAAAVLVAFATYIAPERTLTPGTISSYSNSISALGQLSDSFGTLSPWQQPVLQLSGILPASQAHHISFLAIHSLWSLPSGDYHPPSLLTLLSLLPVISRPITFWNSSVASHHCCCYGHHHCLCRCGHLHFPQPFCYCGCCSAANFAVSSSCYKLGLQW